jgi:uncharacterized damage-inducible protein DinB
MKTETSTEITKELFVKMSISAWDTENARITKLLDSLSDEQLMAETAPGRNRGIYLIGHLASVSDGFFNLFGWGERLYPHLEIPFVKNADRSAPDTATPAEVRVYWNEIYSKLTEAIKKASTDEWFTRHTAVSEADFAKEPHRNKLNVLINRTNHMSYHRGQLVYLVQK